GVVNGRGHDVCIVTGWVHPLREQQTFAGTRAVVSVLPSPTFERGRVENDVAVGTVALVEQAEPWQIVWLMHRYGQTGLVIAVHSGCSGPISAMFEARIGCEGRRVADHVGRSPSLRE